MTMPTPAPGDTVVLVGELRAASGRIAEIGERARVIACGESSVVLELVGATDGERFDCPRSAVTPLGQASSRAGRAGAPWRPRLVTG